MSDHYIINSKLKVIIVIMMIISVIIIIIIISFSNNNNTSTCWKSMTLTKMILTTRMKEWGEKDWRQ